MREYRQTEPAQSLRERLWIDCPGPAESSNHPPVDDRRGRGQYALDVLVRKNAAHRERASRARGSAQLRGEHRSRSGVVRDVEQPLDTICKALKTTRQAYAREAALDCGAPNRQPVAQTLEHRQHGCRVVVLHFTEERRRRQCVVTTPPPLPRPGALRTG